MRNRRWSLAGLFACGLPTACATPCIDDGLGQDNCPTQDDLSATDDYTGPGTNTETVTDTMGTATMGTATVGMTGSQTGTESDTDTLDGTATEGDTDTTTGPDTDTDTAGGMLWCVDADGDGFGDPDMCQQSDEPIDGSVDNDDDCDDTNESTFPGAAPNDDRTACMQDEDHDDWGDDQPPPGVDVGTDCLDDDASIFPGAATEELPPDLCAQDQDGDGWGDTDPPPGADPGNDCDDTNPDIRPGAAEQEPDLCAEDGDDDGWGDTDPPPGVDPGTDCDDGNVYTYPGAAPNDDADACMQDEDDDDWGDDTPPPGVDVGTDCDDTNPDAFPGAAPNESPPTLCTVDADGDGWGDANPPGGGGGGGGPVPGSDCYDTSIDLNPDTVQLTTFLPYNGAPAAPRVIDTVDEATGALAPFVTLLTPAGAIPNANIVTATFNESMEIYTNDLTAAQLYTVDYALTCGGFLGEVEPVGMPYGVGGIDIVCGLEFGDSGNLYGISHSADELQTFDPVTGQEIGMGLPLTLGMGTLDVNSCGMARDCTEGRLLVANGGTHDIFSVDEATGATLLLRDLTPYIGEGTWTPVGLEYDPVSRMVFLSTGNALYLVDLVNDVAPVFITAFPEQVSNLQYLPVCNP
jgi:hypothetical protein